MSNDPHITATATHTTPQAPDEEQSPAPRLSRREYKAYFLAMVVGYLVAGLLYFDHWKPAHQIPKAIAAIVVIAFALTTAEPAMNDNRWIKRIRTLFACATGGGALASSLISDGSHSHVPFIVGALAWIPAGLFAAARRRILDGSWSFLMGPSQGNRGSASVGHGGHRSRLTYPLFRLRRSEERDSGTVSPALQVNSKGDCPEHNGREGEDCEIGARVSRKAERDAGYDQRVVD